MKIWDIREEIALYKNAKGIAHLQTKDRRSEPQRAEIRASGKNRWQSA
jgi:hypothetical protein